MRSITPYTARSSKHKHVSRRKVYSTRSVREWTFEVNPATVSRAKATRLRELGINRISIAVRLWDDGILKTLGCAHTAAQASAAYRVLREAGFRNINLDLMFAIPGQTRGKWRDSLRRTIALAPAHIFAYCLSEPKAENEILRSRLPRAVRTTPTKPPVDSAERRGNRGKHGARNSESTALVTKFSFLHRKVMVINITKFPENGYSCRGVSLDACRIRWVTARESLRASRNKGGALYGWDLGRFF